ncbi:FAD-dependent thymidylate synthase [Candidatus Woesearchaeota archaeon]|nr:FAD-dependent thymidylate synthase [Candidatus Woesearchaeota archaeon]
MTNQRRIYTLNGLPPEVIAVAFAKCSRSPESFDVIAKELNEDKSRQFHEKWVVGYGHSSVAEHAVLSLAIENVSMLASKVIEDNRLASYTEKSTRYQQFDKTTYYKPELNQKLNKLYIQTMDYIMDTYTELIPKLTEFTKKKHPDLKEIEIKNKVFDNLRNLLPVSVLTNIGFTVNARNLEKAIVKLMTHPLKEMNEIGYDLKHAALKHAPTLIKYTGTNEYIKNTAAELKKQTKQILDRMPDDITPVTLVEYDKDAEEKILSAILYKFSNLPYNVAKEKLNNLEDTKKEELLKKAIENIGKFDAPIREFEHAYYTFDLLMDYGAFRDIQRHRMVTQTNQELTPFYGFDIPKEVMQAGLMKDYVECMKSAKNTYRIIHEKFPNEAQYVLPMAFKKRVLFKANYRELYHFIKLRSSKQGHESYRKIAKGMYIELEKVHPFLAGFIKVDLT